MGLTARKPEGSDFELIPAETYQGICYLVVDLGTQHITYGDIETDKPRVIFGWEIPELRIEIERDGKKVDMPRVVSKEYTISLHKKSNLRPMLEKWRGKAFTPDEEKGFHLKNVLGANCMIQILHDTSKKTGEPYHYVADITKLYRDIKPKKAENEYVYFNFDEHDEIPDNVYEWLVKKIMNSYEYQELLNGKPEMPPEEDMPDVSTSGSSWMSELGDDIPF